MPYSPIPGIFMNLEMNYQLKKQNLLNSNSLLFMCCSGELPWTTAVLLIHASVRSDEERNMNFHSYADDTIFIC